MASSHKLKDPNGDPNLSPQDKSVNVRLPNQGIDSPSNETVPSDYETKSTVPSDYVDQIVKHYEEAGESYIKAIDKITSPEGLQEQSGRQRFFDFRRSCKR